MVKYGTNCVLHSKKQPRLGKTLHTPQLPSKLKLKTSGRVLTSLENLKMIEECEENRKEAWIKEERRKAEKRIQNERLEGGAKEGTTSQGCSFERVT